MEYLDFTLKLAKKAGKILLKESQEIIVTEKTTNDFVTNADLAAEKAIIKAINKKYPDHAVLAEESANEELAESDYLWIIDPLDGTNNYAHRIPFYAVSIGLLEIKQQETSKNYQYRSGEIICGAIYIPTLDEMFYAAKGTGSFLKVGRQKPQKLHVSNIRQLANAMTATGFPPTHKERNLPQFNNITLNSQATRRLGSAAIDLAYLAAGRIDLFWEYGLHPWDIAAGSLIVEEAGGVVTDTNGAQLDLFGRDLLATNGHIHQETINTL